MKLTEKTLELNVCAQMSSALPGSMRILWFGLTQRQEARAGFDACRQLGGRILIFQFKASVRILKRSDERFFIAPHPQICALKRIADGHGRSVFYAFPLIGSTAELKSDTDLLSRTWLLDLSDLPPMPKPTTAAGPLRKNHCHNIYVTPGKAVIRSDPVERRLLPFPEVFFDRDSIFERSPLQPDFELFRRDAGHFGPGARGAVIW